METEEDVFKAHADIPAGTLTLQRENEDAIVLPLAESKDCFFTPAGLPATNRTRGLLFSKDKKVLR